MLKCDDGSESRDQTMLCDIAKNYFEELFRTGI